MIRARMDTTRVRSVLDMGFTRDLVYKVIENRLTTVGELIVSPLIGSILTSQFEYLSLPLSHSLALCSLLISLIISMFD